MGNNKLHNDFLSVRPLVSILLPVYNGGPYLSSAIESILTQTYRHIELIIINDGSTDDSAEIIEKFPDPRIRYFDQVNKGLPATLNRAIGLVRGEYIARQDADDISYPTRIEKQVSFLEANPEYGIVGSWSEIWDGNSKTDRSHRHPIQNDMLRFNLIFDSYFVHSSVMLRKSVFDMVGQYSEERSRQPEDYELWSRILRSGKYKCANLPEVLVCYREVPQSICRSGTIPFSEHVAKLCAENLAWASEMSVSDPVISDIVTLIHDLSRRLSSKPDLDAMLAVLHRAACKIAGNETFDEPGLRKEFQSRCQAIRSKYFACRFGARAGKVLLLLADLINRMKAGDELNFGTSSVNQSKATGPGVIDNRPASGVVPGSRQNSAWRPDEQVSIDVVIPVFNGGKFIVQALDSVVRQTYPPAKIIVIDDGSTDNTRELVTSFKSDVPIEYVWKDNGGPSSARNAGIGRCTGNYVAFLDADDAWIPEKLAEQVRVFHESDNSNLGVVYCKYGIIDEVGIPTDEHYVFELDPSIRGKIFRGLLAGNKICGSCSGVLVKKECLDRVGFFDESLCNCEDWDLWLRLAELFEFDFVPLELVKIRRHLGNNQNETLRMFASLMLFYNKWLSRLPDNAECFSTWRRIAITHVVTKAPRGKYYEAIIGNISENNRHKLFRISGGSVFLYLLLVLPVIQLGLLKNALAERFCNK